MEAIIASSDLVTGLMIKLISATPKNAQVSFEPEFWPPDFPQILDPKSEHKLFGRKHEYSGIWWSPQLRDFRLSSTWSDEDEDKNEIHKQNKIDNYWYEMWYGPARPVDAKSLARLYEKYKMMQGIDVG